MVRKRVITIGLVLGLAGIQAAYPIDWKMLEPDNYVDVDSVQKFENNQYGNNIYTYRTMDRRIGKKLYGDNFDYGILQYIINCDTKQNATKAITVFNKQGEVLANTVYNGNEIEWLTINNGSKNEYFYDLCCKPNNKVTQNESVTSTQIYDKTVKSAVYVETKDKNGKLLGTGSGVIVLEDGTFVTCFHVIANADVIEVKLKDGSSYKVKGFRYINPLEDIAILTIDTTRKFIPIKINNIDDTKIGEKIYALANPQGIQFTFTDGMINQQTENIIQFSAPASPGSSGGILLNNSGSLIGIISSQLRPNESQNINFAIPTQIFTTKIQNQQVINNAKLWWTDFLISRADSDQLKIYAKVAIYNENYNLLYKALLPFTKRSDFPKDRYAMMGLIAMSIDQYKDSIYWFNKSIEADYDIELSAFNLCLLAMFSEDNILNDLLTKGLGYLKEYKTTYDTVKLTYDKVLKCEGRSGCKGNIIGEVYNYAQDLWEKYMGKKLYDYDWFLKLEK